MSSAIIVTKAVVLDVDDTLYLERDYVRSGFDAVEQYLKGRGAYHAFAERAWELFEQGARGNIFDMVLSEHQNSSIDVSELISVYRAHVPKITLCPDAERFIDRRPPLRPLGVITDGPVESQSAKVEVLLTGKGADPIVLSDAFGSEYRKPHERSFEHVERCWQLPATDLTYIADNPTKDFITPKRRGWLTIRISRAGGEHFAKAAASADYDAEKVIKSFDELEW